MGIELIIAEELATASATLTELSSISRVLNSLIKSENFRIPYYNMLSELAGCYQVIIDNLTSFCTLDNETAFTTHFEAYRTAFSECYLNEISKPRSHSDEAYEIYLELMTLKESKTGYPLLKQIFARLDAFIDKWVTNDAWLAMSIDNLFKRVHRLLNEIAELKQKDAEDAFILYQSTFTEIAAFLMLIEAKRKLLHPVEMDSSSFKKEVLLAT